MLMKIHHLMKIQVSDKSYSAVEINRGYENCIE